MKTSLILCWLLIGIAGNAQIKIDKQHFVNLLSQGKYGDVFREAQEIRKKEYGKCLLIDFFIAQALCGDGHYKEAGIKYAGILKNYKLSEANRNFITNEMKMCRPGDIRAPVKTINVNIRDFSNIMAMNLPEAAVRGKMGMIANCRMNPQDVIYTRAISTEELESRLFALDKGAEAINKFKSILNNNYHIGVSGRFLLITYGSTILNNEQLTQTSQRLEDAYNFFIRHYNLRPPDKLLTVYLLPDKYTFRQTAMLIHGVKVPDANIGYSNISDLSLVGVSDVTRIGTLCHEMFHLIVRTDVGDVPPWMDEGIACIYETSKWSGSELTGDLNNWRTEVLRGAVFEMPDKIPTLKDFIGYNWHQFDGFEANDLCKASIHYAYGKHLMLYLQEQGKLKALLSAAKNRKDITEYSDTLFQSDADLIEQTLNASSDTIEKRFNQWMYQKYRIKLAAYRPATPLVSPNADRQDPMPNDLPNVVRPGTRRLNEMQQVTVPDSGSIRQEIVQQAYPNQMVQQSPVFNDAVIQPPNESHKSAAKLTANEVANVLTVHVKKNFNDKMGEAISYRYYLEGDNKILDNIAEVYYQRNNQAFSEFKDKSFRKSVTRVNNFSFEGYQSDSAETVFIYVIMKDKTKSAAILKTIIYDD